MIDTPAGDQNPGSGISDHEDFGGEFNIGLHLAPGRVLWLEWVLRGHVVVKHA